jgi:hypothetical protein
MDVEITPEPAPTERRALLLALEQANLRGSTAEIPRNAWRVAALCEAVDAEDADLRYAFSPRSTRGATRA